MDIEDLEEGDLLFRTEAAFFPPDCDKVVVVGEDVVEIVVVDDELVLRDA